MSYGGGRVACGMLKVKVAVAMGEVAGKRKVVRAISEKRLVESPVEAVSEY